MKLAGTEATRYLAKPDPARAGLLIFGADAMRVALKRQEVIAALVGPKGEEEMRLTRIPGAALRKDATLLLDAVKAMGFFPGPRVAFVEDATDTCAEALLAALREWRAGDAVIVVTAGNLTPKSGLKSLMEKHPSAVCIGLYDDPPSREEVEAMLAKAGLARIEPAAMAELLNLSRGLDPGDFRQTIEKISMQTSTERPFSQGFNASIVHSKNQNIRRNLSILLLENRPLLLKLGCDYRPELKVVIAERPIPLGKQGEGREKCRPSNK